MSINALLTLKGDGTSAVGRDRIRLLEAVAREGSITKGAKAVGITYKAAWDGLDAMQNLFGAPLLEKQAGGKAGGGAKLTPTGLQIIQAFHRLESELDRLVRAVEPELDGTGISPFNLVSGLLMKTSARNLLRGTVTSITSDALSADVGVAVSADTTIHAIITHESLRELGLVEGREATVLIKAPFVVLATGETAPQVSTRNCFKGVVARCNSGPVNAEVVIDIGDGKTLTATVTAHSIKKLKLEPGAPVHALIDASHVILAIN